MIGSGSHSLGSHERNTRSSLLAVTRPDHFPTRAQSWRALVMTRLLMLGLFATACSAQAAEWEQSLASTASLRTGGARLVSSDVLKIDSTESALITYWESASDAPNRDIYRCVDIVGPDFSPLRQTCWKVLAPAGGRPTEIG